MVWCLGHTWLCLVQADMVLSSLEGCVWSIQASVCLMIAPQLYSLTDYGQWTMDHGSWTKDHGQWTMGNGPWTMDHGSWTMDCGLWTMGYGL